MKIHIMHFLLFLMICRVLQKCQIYLDRKFFSGDILYKQKKMDYNKDKGTTAYEVVDQYTET